MNVITPLPITLVMIVRNSGARLKQVIEEHRRLVSDVVVIDQSSTDGTWEVAQEFADLAFKRRNKGKCEPDRNLAFELGSQPWVLNLDDDEFIDPEDFPKVKQAIESGADVIWMNRKNFVDGKAMDFMGTDQQCRLFKRGSVRWSDQTHTYAERAGNAMVLHSDISIKHYRTLKQIKDTHERRSRVLEPKMLELEKNFIKQVEQTLQKA